MIKTDRSIRLATDEDKKAWDQTVSHPLQSWVWGEFRRSMGIAVVRLAVFQHSKLVDGWQLTFHNIPHTPWTIGYLPKGPIPSEEMLHALKIEGKKHNAIFIQLEPNVLNNQQSTINNQLLRPSHHPLFTKYTFILDLTKSEEELLASMHPKTRYNIRVATKHGVRVALDNSDDAFDAYLALNEETTKRQGFYAHSPNYHKTLWRILRPFGMANLFTATYKTKVVAAWMTFTWGGIIYYPYGTSSRQHREVMAPVLLLWEIARWAKKRGCRAFDLWGALGPNPNQNDPWYGFHRFKEGFRPEFVTFVGSYDLVLQPFAYLLYTIADSLRWTYLRLARK